MNSSHTSYPVTVQQCCKGPSESEANKHSRKHRRHGAKAHWLSDKFKNLMIQKWNDITGLDSMTDRGSHQDRDTVSTCFCLQLFFPVYSVQNCSIITFFIYKLENQQRISFLNKMSLRKPCSGLLVDNRVDLCRVSLI